MGTHNELFKSSYQLLEELQEVQVRESLQVTHPFIFSLQSLQIPLSG